MLVVFSILLSLGFYGLLLSTSIQSALWGFISFITLVFICWLLPLKWPAPVLKQINLALSTIVCFLAILLGEPSILVFTAAIIALANWFIQHLITDQKKCADPDRMKPVIQKNMLTICILLVSILIFQIVVQSVQIQLPFWAAIVTIGVLVVCLERVWSFLQS